MTVEISARPVAALRAQLSGNASEHQRLVREFGRDDKLAYSALEHAAFLEAARRRFAGQGQESAVIEYVADVRSRADEVADAVDPQAAERLILEAVGRGTADGIDSKTASVALLFLLTALIADEGLDDAALDQFIDRATSTADFLLNGDA